jgi:hypothetical protein
MSEESAASPIDRESLLVVAAFIHGREPKEEIRANCWRVLAQAIRWAGQWNDRLEQDVRHDIDNPFVDDWYRTLIAMIGHEPANDALIEGRGNFGSETEPAADPRFTGCRATVRGRQMAENLLATQPQLFCRPIGLNCGAI